MKKKHFVILGRSGLIYFSWILIVFFLSLIFLYESTKAFNWPALICVLVFIILLLYSYFNSYWDKENFKLPFRFRTQVSSEPSVLLQWHYFKIYEIELDEFGHYYLLRIEK
ncbi:MAG: acyltransferase [Lactobacillus sp.]|nr:acyltransferase [Lactobacillus sp.]